MGGASGTPSSPTPHETQQESFPEVNSVCLLLPSASKESGTSDEAYGEGEIEHGHCSWSGSVFVGYIRELVLSEGLCVSFTAADALVVEHDSVVAAKLKLLERGASCHD